MNSAEETGKNRGDPKTEIGKDDEISLPLPAPSHEEANGNPMVSKQGESRENSEAEPKKIDISDQMTPRGVLEIPITGSSYSDNSSSSSSNESVSPEGSGLESHSLQWRALISGLLTRKKALRRFSMLPLAMTTSSEISKKNLRRIRSAEDHPVELEGSVPLVRWKPSWRNFDYQELAAATDNFNPERLVGKGGHAEVYKGCLPDGQLVAVKRLTKKENEEERVGDFLSELGIIAHVNHPNAAHLLGFGVEGGLHLVLQFSPHGSLASKLHGSKEGLEWAIRFKVALGVAEGLLYLHQGCHRRIIHRDIKASNILLKEDYQPQISDFGLAKWLPDKWTHHIVFPIEGTFGYLAPEYFMHGVVSEKTDVFAFGVLLLELITGRRAVDSCRQSLVILAKPLLDANNVKELVDPRLGDAYEPSEMDCVISAASACIHHMSTMRPHMNRVIQLLRGEIEGSPETTVRESKPAVRKPLLFDACDLDDYTCSRYLNDLNRHKQLALEQ